MAILTFAVVMQLMFMTAGQDALTQKQMAQDGGNGNVHGVVLNPEGVGFPGVGVTMRDQASGTEYSIRTNSHGEYSFTNLPPGNYDVQLVAPALTYVPFMTLKLASVEVIGGKTINLNSKMKVSETWVPIEGSAAFRLPPTKADIQGVVLDDLGAATAGVDVTLLIESSSVRERKTKTDSQGVYLFIDLQPGKYEIRLNGKKFCTRMLSAKVVVGKTKKVNTQLKTAQLPC